MLKRVSIEQLYLSPRRIGRGTPPVSEALQRLVKRFGPVLPVIVRATEPQRFEILRNAETWVAAQRAGYHDLPILIREGVSDAEVEALLRMDAKENPISRANRYARQLARSPNGKRYGDVAALARKERRSRSYIAHHLRLLELPPLVQEAISKGMLNVGQAKAIAGCDSNDHQHRLATAAITGGWSVRQTEAAVHRSAKNQVHLRQLERELSEHLGSPVKLDAERGHLVINYHKDLDVLHGVLEKFGWDTSTY